jgi:metal-responsive CopG/Arc/MetJ family transcriptional regulator
MISVIPEIGMAKGSAKVAVSLPEPLYRAVEAARRRSGSTRSAVVQEALREWLRRRAQGDLVREYEAGYRRRPEQAAELERALALSTELLRDEDDAW